LFSLPTTLSAFHTLSPPVFTSPSLSFPNLSPHYPPHTLTSLLYQPYTPPAPCNLWHKHPPLQKKYNKTHKRATKSSSSHPSSPNTFPLSPSPFLVPSTQVSTARLITITPPNSQCL
jgi:hypothetical protein